MRAGVRQMINQIPDFPDRYNPEDQHPSTPSLLNSEDVPTRPKYRRIEREVNQDEEQDNLAPIHNPVPQTQLNQNFQKGRARLDSNIDIATPPRTDLQSSASGSSNLQASQSSEAEQHTAPSARLIRLGRGGRRPRRVQRRDRNAFIDDEAEESHEADEDSGFAAAPTSNTHSHSDSNFASETDSESEADNSFIVGDDCFE